MFANSVVIVAIPLNACIAERIEIAKKISEIARPKINAEFRDFRNIFLVLFFIVGLGERGFYRFLKRRRLNLYGR